MKPRERRLSASARCVVSRLLGKGKVTINRVPSGNAITRSTTLVTVSGTIRRSHFGQCVCPTRANRSRR